MWHDNFMFLHENEWKSNFHAWKWNFHAWTKWNFHAWKMKVLSKDVRGYEFHKIVYSPMFHNTFDAKKSPEWPHCYAWKFYFHAWNCHANYFSCKTLFVRIHGEKGLPQELDTAFVSCVVSYIVPAWKWMNIKFPCMKMKFPCMNKMKFPQELDTAFVNCAVSYIVGRFLVYSTNI